MNKENIRVIKKYGVITGKEMFKVKGDPNAWCDSPQSAINQHYRCAAWWDNYHKTGGKK